MAVFGVPTAHEDDGERAVRAALAVRDHVRALNEGRAGLSFPDVHAGVNSGEVMVGPSDEASGYTVMGDTVNTASRMADLATAGHVLVDASTRTLTASSIRYGPRRMRKAKGKAEPFATFEALGPLARDPASARGGAFVDREEFFAPVRARAGRDRGGRVFARGGPHGRAGHRKEPARPGARKLTCTRSVPPGPLRPVRRTPAVLARGGRCVRARCGRRHGARRHTRGDRSRGPADRADAPRPGDAGPAVAARCGRSGAFSAQRPRHHACDPARGRGRRAARDRRGRARRSPVGRRLDRRTARRRLSATPGRRRCCCSACRGSRSRGWRRRRCRGSTSRRCGRWPNPCSANPARPTASAFPSIERTATRCSWRRWSACSSSMGPFGTMPMAGVSPIPRRCTRCRPRSVS